jgi:hypothetical protein
MKLRALQILAIAALFLGVFATGCTSKAQGKPETAQTTRNESSLAKVEGHTYTGNGGVVVIEFKKNGRAFMNAGPVSQSCTYTQSGNKVVLHVLKDTINFTVDEEDGALLGPNEGDGMLSRLTRKN